MIEVAKKDYDELIQENKKLKAFISELKALLEKD